MAPKVRNETSGKSRGRPRQFPKTENSVGRRIVGALEAGGRDLAWLSDATGIPPNTLGDYVRRGIRNADNAVTIAAALGVSLDWLLRGRGEAGSASAADEDEVRIPIRDMGVAAGHGVYDRGGVHFADLTFPRQWLLRSFGHVDGLELIRVEGDSQEPDLSDGDWVMIDNKRRELRDGLHAVVLDDALLVKRVQLEGRTIRLLSANPLYEPIVVDREGDRHFSVIGKVVWSGKIHARG